MMAGRGAHMAAVGGPARHIPVMLSEVLLALEPESGAIIVDGTFGRGGHSRTKSGNTICRRERRVDQPPTRRARPLRDANP